MWSVLAPLWIVLANIHSASAEPNAYNGPVIGVLSQKTNGKMTKFGHSYIAASYVKYLEMAGNLDLFFIKIFPLFFKNPVNLNSGKLNPYNTFLQELKFTRSWIPGTLRR